MFEKLYELARDEVKAREVFSGTKEEMIKKLEAYDIYMTEEEFDAFMENAKKAASGEAELDLGDLDDVTGGCKTCENWGKAIGKFLKWLFF